MAYGVRQHLPGAVIAGRFEIARLIAQGGMGAVYEARDIASGRAGALKLLQPQYAVYPIAVERFTREAVLASRIASPHIVAVLDAGRLETGEPYMFMDLLQGESMRARLDRAGVLAWAEARQLVLQAADGLIAAHAAGIIHRDVKPENLFIVDAPSPTLKVLDFGISKVLWPDWQALTKKGLPMGTFQYMPPEQMNGAERVDERADIYSLGVVLYESLVGRPPFVAKAVPALLLLMMQQRYEAASVRRSDLPPACDGVLGRCLAADPEQRYPSMQAFATALGAMAQREQAV